MLRISPTEQLLEIRIEGGLDDFQGLEKSIYNLMGLEEETELTYLGLKCSLLELCHKLHRAYKGDSDIGIPPQERENWERRAAVMPAENGCYHAKLFFPEAIFIAAAAPRMSASSSGYYGIRRRQAQTRPTPLSGADYLRDRANMDVFCAGVWQALGQVIGAGRLEQILRLMQRSEETYEYYAVRYIEKCSLELARTDAAKRQAKLGNIARRIITKPQGYYKAAEEMRR